MANEDLNFRCKDVGFNECPWEAKASNEQELLDRVRQHGRESHGINNWDQSTENKVRGAIRRRPAA